ncbi:2'-5' RNA ligase superfamily-domain-containing protein [Lophiotrema nucula]|uniref:2'-5' RNA ligase superfamily-domain-containing protein n=1 Tax=Lophiotrema nucula TaxID=690887 RepID=A0A6A5ZKS9_9PLEO|nr:2'-5' RNA ligase superfamily-domain-containing protein [Lophiotrema nucula]
MASRLPPHLSYKSSLALLPPTSITAPVEGVRKVHDKHFARWPPHINLIYPFVASPSEEEADTPDVSPRHLKHDILTRLNKAVKDVQPFNVSLSADPAGSFHHSKKSKTVWLNPISTTDAIHDLQAALQAEFAECNADTRPFNPHLSIGQAKSDDGAESLSLEAKRSVADFLMSSRPEEQREARSVALDWSVDKLFVIERKGFHDRFVVVGVVELGK